MTTKLIFQIPPFPLRDPVLFMFQLLVLSSVEPFWTHLIYRSELISLLENWPYVWQTPATIGRIMELMLNRWAF